jgi:hypothetical protein
MSDNGQGVGREVEVVPIEMVGKAASGPRAASGEVLGNEVTERASRAEPVPEVAIESGRGPEGPTIVAAPERVPARNRAELGDDPAAP